MKRERFDDAWFAIEASDAAAVNMTIRSELMSSIERAVKKWKLPQAEAASRLGITRPRLNDLLRGKISKFSLDALTTLATRAGLSVKLNVRKAAGRRAA
jgi:predicted XRE-type DNA-binding protein